MGQEDDLYRCPVCTEWGRACNCLREYEREGYEPKRDEPNGTNRGASTRLRQRDCE